ncbi:glycine/sarcosine/betaine reductase selenoprotein B family protein [Salirhabdus salicampi]|uniref:glycine/sarcosine/betaine reductase selenoprotein B family protein n=1 Tax=Salirhabdus salicampi TaxID=476102 RepID=UPI0020C2762E|nr:glycine/sarcosine/betaine reductase selenoprotein B family protein [Salirhabdus salicampi]MCP8616271.1 glycine/sarcosine/betaine reductase selenoprotein B family protein [Salirhabdus salicampi]
MELSRKAIPYTPMGKPLHESTIMIVSTSGVHLKNQEPYNTEPSEGDSTFRVIPGDVDANDLTVTHAAPKEHYNTDAPKEDINCVFPIDRLREMVDDGDIGGVAEKHLTMMGYSMRLNKINKETIPALVKEVVRSKADAVLLTAG